jgi:hypothetical protein
MRWWEWYTGVFGATIDANPSPGNKEGGLTTIYEKSLGAVAKAGSTPLVEVYDYAARITKKGLTFMDTPGHDRFPLPDSSQAAAIWSSSPRARFLPRLQTRSCPQNRYKLPLYAAWRRYGH